MRKLCSRIIAPVCAISLLFSGCSMSVSVDNNPDTVAKDSNYIGAYAVMRDGDVIYSNATGYADNAHTQSNTADTIFNIASVTKQITASAVLKLQEQGKLSVNDTLDKYFPDYRYGSEITLHQLLCMKSGLRDYMNDESVEAAQSIDELPFKIKETATYEENLAAMTDWVMSASLEFEPGTDDSYCNTNYNLLAQIVTKVSGTDFRDFVTENFFKPLGMTSSSFNKANAAEPDSSECDEQSKWMYFDGVEVGDGAVYSNVTDMLKWADGLVNGKVITQDSLDMMFTNYGDDYGYGIIIGDENDVYFHGGHDPGYYAHLRMNIADKSACVLLSNDYDSGSYIRLTAKAMLDSIETEETDE